MITLLNASFNEKPFGNISNKVSATLMFMYMASEIFLVSR